MLMLEGLLLLLEGVLMLLLLHEWMLLLLLLLLLLMRELLEGKSPLNCDAMDYSFISPDEDQIDWKEQ